jgi:uncharacterized protein (DUF1778 family)
VNRRRKVEMATATSRGERLVVRADPAEKARFEQAARLARENLSEFVRRAVEERAEEVFASQAETVLSDADYAAVRDALNSPRVPNAALQRAAAQPRRFTHK